MLGLFLKRAKRIELYHMKEMTAIVTFEARALFPESGIYDYCGVTVDFAGVETREKLLFRAIQLCRDTWLQRQGEESFRDFLDQRGRLAELPVCNYSAEKAMVFDLALTAIRLDKLAEFARPFDRDGRVRSLFIYAGAMVVHCVDRSCDNGSDLRAIEFSSFNLSEFGNLFSGRPWSMSSLCTCMPNVKAWCDYVLGRS